MDTPTPIINAVDIGYTYPNGRVVLRNLNFSLHQKEKVGLIGDNGSGKTTFLHVIMGLLPLSSGQLYIYGNPIKGEPDFRQVRKKIGLLFQNPEDQLFCPTVLDDVAFGPLNLGKSPSEAREISLNTLDLLNLMDFKDRLTHHLSGGEKKLVSLAAVLAMQPEVLLLDEPTTALDEPTRKHLTQILNQLDISCVIVSHEFEFLAATTNTLYCMYDGQIHTDSESEAIHYHYHSHPLGKITHRHV